MPLSHNLDDVGGGVRTEEGAAGGQDQLPLLLTGVDPPERPGGAGERGRERDKPLHSE